MTEQGTDRARPRGRAFLFAAIAALLAAAAAAWWLYVPSTYFAANEVDHVAAPLRGIELDFPETKLGADLYGTLRMNVFIDHHGVVDRIDVLESTVPPSYREYAIAVFRATRFEPAKRGGRAVRSVKKVEVVFKPAPRAGRLTPER